MVEDRVQMYCGSGAGRSAAAVGQGVRYACSGKSVYIVCFLKGKASLEYQYLQRLEPEIKLFCFDKFDSRYRDLNEEEQQEERIHVKNGLQYARKVASNAECDVLILDEVLDLVALDIIRVEELIDLIRSADEGIHLILTGKERCERVWPYVDRVTEISTLKQSQDSEQSCMDEKACL